MVKNGTFCLIKSADFFFVCSVIPCFFLSQFFQVYKNLNVLLVFHRRMKNSLNYVNFSE